MERGNVTMKRWYGVMLAGVIYLSSNRAMGYFKIGYENYEFNRPFSKKEMLFKKADYVCSDRGGKRRCYVRLSVLDKNKIKKSLAEYAREEKINSEMIKIFLSKRRPHDQMVGWVLQDFLTRQESLGSTITVGQLLQELGLDSI
jgi:hypothetical protein